MDNNKLIDRKILNSTKKIKKRVNILMKIKEMLNVIESLNEITIEELRSIGFNLKTGFDIRDIVTYESKLAKGVYLFWSSEDSIARVSWSDKNGNLYFNYSYDKDGLIEIFKIFNQPC